MKHNSLKMYLTVSSRIAFPQEQKSKVDCSSLGFFLYSPPQFTIKRKNEIMAFKMKLDLILKL